MIKISGYLKNGFDEIIPFCEILLTSIKNSANVTKQTVAKTVTDKDGYYDISVLPCDYSVIIKSSDTRYSIGQISVYEDSVDGTINEFLIEPGASDVSPEIIQTLNLIKNEVEQYRLSSEAAAERSELAARAADESKDIVVSNVTTVSTALDNAQSLVSDAQQFSISAKASAEKSGEYEKNAKQHAEIAKESAKKAEAIMTESNFIEDAKNDGDFYVRGRNKWLKINTDIIDEVSNIVSEQNLHIVFNAKTLKKMGYGRHIYSTSLRQLIYFYFPVFDIETQTQKWNRVTVSAGYYLIIDIDKNTYIENQNENSIFVSGYISAPDKRYGRNPERYHFSVDINDVMSETVFNNSDEVNEVIIYQNRLLDVVANVSEKDGVNLLFSLPESSFRGLQKIYGMNIFDTNTLYYTLKVSSYSDATLTKNAGKVDFSPNGQVQTVLKLDLPGQVGSFGTYLLSNPSYPSHIIEVGVGAWAGQAYYIDPNNPSRGRMGLSVEIKRLNESEYGYVKTKENYADLIRKMKEDERSFFRVNILAGSYIEMIANVSKIINFNNAPFSITNNVIPPSS